LRRNKYGNSSVIGSNMGPGQSGVIDYADGWARVWISGKINSKRGVVNIISGNPHEPNTGKEGYGGKFFGLQLVTGSGNPGYYFDRVLQKKK